MAQSRQGRVIARKERMLHIRLDAELHQRLRLVTAAEDTSLQDWIKRTLQQAVARSLPKIPGKSK